MREPELEVLSIKRCGFPNSSDGLTRAVPHSCAERPRRATSSSATIHQVKNNLAAVIVSFSSSSISSTGAILHMTEERGTEQEEDSDGGERGRGEEGESRVCVCV